MIGLRDRAARRESAQPGAATWSRTPIRAAQTILWRARSTIYPGALANAGYPTTPLTERATIARQTNARVDVVATRCVLSLPPKLVRLPAIVTRDDTAAPRGEQGR
jgi:hypothetical protein